MKQAGKLIPMLEAARKGGFSLWMLNLVLGRVIPFNKKHGFKIHSVEENTIRTYAPYQRRNFNHIRGIHACGIATIAEFATGITLLRRVDASQYRIIMSDLNVKYHFQAKKPLIAEATATLAEIENEILKPLQSQDAVSKVMVSEIRDVDGNHIATAHITWQFKPWDKVRTKVNG